MKNRKKMIIMIIIIGIIICCSGIYIFLLRNFFYNKYNIHAQRAVMDRLSERYNQEFELLSIEFETREVETKGAKYVHLWTFTLKDNQGRQFYAYVRSYGLVKIGDGNSHAADYSSYIDDTYGQLCIEERFGDKFDLYQYRQEKGSRLADPEWEDYIFICTKNNVTEIAELLTEIYFKETEFSNGGCLKCLVNNEEGESLFSYYWWDITRELQKQDKEITEQTVYAYILQELMGDSLIDEYVDLSDDTEVESYEWMSYDSGDVLRVRVQYKTPPANSYQHKEDYFLFIQDENVSQIFLVDYEDKGIHVGLDEGTECTGNHSLGEGCNFDAHFEDVTFDGRQDLVISVGNSRHAEYYCAYVNENSAFRYEKSFEHIPSYKTDVNKKVIYGSDTDGMGLDSDTTYEYKNGEFVLIDANEE